MPLSWVVRDGLGQLNVLIARKGQLEISETGIKPTARSADLTALTPAGVGNPQALNEPDIKTAIKGLQQFLLTLVSVDDIAEVCQHLMTLAKQYESIDHNKVEASEAGKLGAPSSTDKKQTIDDTKDNSVTFLILDTMCLLLGGVLGLDGASDKKTPVFRLDDRAPPAAPAAVNSAGSPTTAVGPIVPADVKANGIANCQAVIPFAFNYLHHIYSSAVRHAASRLLGILSITFLGQITGMFIDKFAQAKKDQAKREYATFQRAVGFLDFRVGPPATLKVTLEYLTALLAEMKNVDRGVLRQEICQSLDSIYTKILSPHVPDATLRTSEWHSFMRSEKGVEDWNVTYERIYTIIAKWSTKSKHTIFCYRLLTHMIVHSRNITFFQNKKRFDVVTELIKGIKSEKGEYRHDLLQILSRNYYELLPSVFHKVESQDYLTTLRTLFPILSPKKTKPIPEEIPILLELIASSAGRQMEFFVDEVAIEILKPGSPYYSRQKALILQALSKILDSSPQQQREMKQFHIQLGPLVSAYIEDSATNPGLYHESGGGAAEEDKAILLLRAALKCFPYIRHQKMEHVVVTAAAVVMLCKHDDREISGAVSAALTNFVKIDLNQFFLPTIHTLCDLLKLDPEIDSRPDQILKICNTISLLCNTLADHLKLQDSVGGANGASGAAEGNSPNSQQQPESSEEPEESPAEEVQQFEVTATAWLALREHLESVVLMRLCHYEGWVRAELVRMLQSFSRPAFRAFESAQLTSPKVQRDLIDIPYLIDYLLPSSCGAEAGSKAAAAYTGIILPTTEVFYKPLHTLLTTKGDAFKGIVSYAFSFTHKSLEVIHPFLDQARVYTEDLVNEEWYLFFRNKLLFCSLAVRSTSQLGESVEGVQMTQHQHHQQAKGQAGGSTHLSANDLGLKFTNSRPRLVHYQAKVHEVFTFYENIISFMQYIPPNQQGMNAAQLLTYNTTPASSGLYLVKLAIAKDLGQIRPGSSPPTPQSPPSAASNSNSPTAAGGLFLTNWIELAKHLRKPVTDSEAAALAAAANPQAPKSKKGRGPDVNGLFYFNEFTTHILAKLFSLLSCEEYHQDVNLFTKTLDDYLQVWKGLYDTNTLDILRNLSIRTRLNTAVLVARFLAFRTGSNIELGKHHVNHLSRFEVMRRMTFFFQLLTNLMPTTSENAAMHAHILLPDVADSIKQLEGAVLNGLNQLLSLDPLQDQALEGQILYFLERILVLHQRTNHVAPHIHLGVSNALNTFLKMNPKYVNEFVRMSMSETHAHLEAAESEAQQQQVQAALVGQRHAQAARQAEPKKRNGSMVLSSDSRHLIHREAHPSFRPVSLVVARYYLRACATNWTQDMSSWKNLHSFGTPQMLAVAMLSQTSSDPESRAIGLLLAAELEKEHANGAGNKSNAHAIRLYSHESPFMYLESTLAYSTSLAQDPSYLSSLLPLLNESVILFEYLSTSKKEAMLRLLQPWVHESVHLILTLESAAHDDSDVNAGRGIVKETIHQVMTALTDLTRYSYYASILTEPIKRMWIALLSNPSINESLVRQMTFHLIDEYNQLVDASAVQKQQQIERAMVATPGRPARPTAAAVTAVRTPNSLPGASPTNLANLTAGVTTAPNTNEPLQPAATPAHQHESTPDSVDVPSDSVGVAQAGIVGSSAAPVSLALESGPDPNTACPSPVDGPHEPMPSPSPSPEAVATGAEHGDLNTPSAGSGPYSLRQPSSVRHALDAGGIARVQATVPLSSPSHVAVQPKIHFTSRNLATEKALRKLILMQLLRSPAANEILVTLMGELRSYEDSCPLDPDAFLKWTELRIPSGGVGVEPAEPVTTAERSVFELLSNAVFENKASVALVANGGQPQAHNPDDDDTDLFHPYYPQLLQNAYVLFHSTPEGHEMLVHLALSLGIYDYADAAHTSRASGHTSSRDMLIGSDKLIPQLVKTYPRLRAAWSNLALTWACNSLDSRVVEVSFLLWRQLEESAFYFGDQNQEQLVKAILMLFQCLRRNEEKNLKSIISTLISPTAYPYDKTGWTSLVSAGWALLVLSSIPQFSLGLSLLQCMFKLPDIPQDEQRKWILSLGRFLCRDSAQEVDTAIVEVLFKGIVSKVTFQPTLMLLQSMATIYSGATLPADNKLMVLLSLVNVMQRMVDLQSVSDVYRKQLASGSGGSVASAASGDGSDTFFSSSPPPQPIRNLDPEQEKTIIRAVDDCVNLSLLTHQYSASESSKARSLVSLATLFKNLALSMSRLLPDPIDEDETNESNGGTTTSSNQNRQLLFNKMVSMVQSYDGTDAGDDDVEERKSNPLSNAHSPRASRDKLDGLHLPTPTQLASQFFLSFTSFFNSLENFNFTLIWFQRMLVHAPPEWRVSLLLMLGHFLLESNHYPDNKQVQLLSELVTQAYFTGMTSNKLDEMKLSEQIAYLMIEKRPAGCNLNRHTDLFNFVRSRTTVKKGAAASNESHANVLVTDAVRYDPQGELAESLARIETHTFAIVKSMLSNPRPCTRPMDAEAVKAARITHARAASAANTLHKSDVAATRRMSFAALNEFKASAMNNHASLPERRDSTQPASSMSAVAPPPSASSHPTVVIDSTPSPAPPGASPRPSPPPAAPRPSQAQLKAISPKPTPVAAVSSNPFANDDDAGVSDDEDRAGDARRRSLESDAADAALFAAAARRLSNSQQNGSNNYDHNRRESSSFVAERGDRQSDSE